MGKREMILENIVSTLTGITKENGYDFDMKYVTREWNEYHNLKQKQYPATIVVWTEEGDEPAGANATYILSRLKVLLRGYIKASKNLEKKLNEYVDNVIIAMEKDSTRGGHANYTMPVRKRAYNTQEQNVIACDIEYSVLHISKYGEV